MLQGDEVSTEWLHYDTLSRNFTTMADPTPSPESNLGTGQDIDAGPRRGAPPGAPRWVKVSGIFALVLALLVAAVLLLGGGGHGPAQHSSSGDAGGRTPVLKHGVTVAAGRAG